MKSIILIRHTKSDWSNLIPDFDRPIREDRKQDAMAVAKEVAGRESIPQHVISSPATRTLQTARMLCAQWNYPFELLVTNNSLYDCLARDILAVIRRTDEKYDNIAVVCHNPAITDFINQYSDTFLVNVPTSGAVKISFETKHWKDIKGSGKADWVLRPKEMDAVAIKADRA